MFLTQLINMESGGEERHKMEFKVTYKIVV